MGSSSHSNYSAIIEITDNLTMRYQENKDNAIKEVPAQLSEFVLGLQITGRNRSLDPLFL